MDSARLAVRCRVGAFLWLVSGLGPLVADEPSPALADWPAPEELLLTAALPSNPLTFVGVLPCRMADTVRGPFPRATAPPSSKLACFATSS